MLCAGVDQLRLAVTLPKPDQNFQRSNVLWKSPISIGQGSSAIVFEACILGRFGQQYDVVIKERRKWDTVEKDEEVLPGSLLNLLNVEM